MESSKKNFIRSALKKATAITTSAMMAGATMFGAIADLSDFPAPFVENGEWNTVVAVGADAQPADVIGAADIAAALAQATTSAASVGTGLTTTTTLTGDAFELSDQSDLLELSEPLGDVWEAITGEELSALASGRVTTDEGSTEYNQYLRFKLTGTSDTLTNTTVIYGQNTASRDEVGDFLHIAEGSNVSTSAFFEYELEFEEGFESVVDGTDLEDFEDEPVNLFGQDFIVVDTDVSGSSTDITIELMSGAVQGTLEEGESATYTIDGKEYEVEVLFVSASTSTTEPTAIISVNGDESDRLSDGETDILDGIAVGVRDVLSSDRGGLVRFFLGATRIKLNDNSFNDTSFRAGVDVTAKDPRSGAFVNENIEDAFVRIIGSVITDTSADGFPDSGDIFEISRIQYRLTADPVSGLTDVYVPPGHGVREYLDEPGGMLNPSWDIKYEGFYDTGSTEFAITPTSADKEYEITFTNRQNKVYRFPFVEVTNGNIFRYGEDNGDDDLEFVEGNKTVISTSANSGWLLNTSSGGGSIYSVYNTTLWAEGDIAFPTSDVCGGLCTGYGSQFGRFGHLFPIDDDDVFVTSNQDSTGFDETAVTDVWRYVSIDTSDNRLITLENLATGEERDVGYVANTNTSRGILLGTSTTLTNQGTFTIYVENTTNTTHSGPNRLAIDLNGDGDINTDEVRLTLKGGGIVDLGNSTPTIGGRPTVTNASSDRIDQLGNGYVLVSLHTEDSEFDEPNTGDEDLIFNVTEDTTNAIVRIPSGQFNYTRGSSVSGDLVQGGDWRANTSLGVDRIFRLEAPDDNDDHFFEATDFGALIDLFDPSGSNDPEELRIDYPNVQRGVAVFITGGSVERKTTTSGGGAGGVNINPITGLPLAKLDTEISNPGSKPIILVGGPAVNRLTADALGLDYPAYGAASTIPEDKALIKLVEDAFGDGSVALVVAGWEAGNTRAASSVLRDYSVYSDELVGDEVVVSGTGANVVLGARSEEETA